MALPKVPHFHPPYLVPSDIIIPESLMESVYKNAGLDPKETGYVEAHGTGTKVGDPIEVAALHKVFGEGRSIRAPLFIGSVKSNIGHLEAASGRW
jgi:acyl transferase domain-containing protein